MVLVLLLAKLFIRIKKVRKNRPELAQRDVPTSRDIPDIGM